MLKILSNRHLVECSQYSRSFKRIDSSGYGFDCDEDGNVYLDKLSPEAYNNYLKCIFGEDSELKDCGVEAYYWQYWEPSIGECVCGCEVALIGFTNTCDNCERDYNMSGQELAPREQWGECEGDSLCDILNIDSVSTDELFE